MLGALSFGILGPKWGILANITIALACFTTIVSLAVASVDILWQTFNQLPLLKRKEKTFYLYGIVIITLMTALFANIGFENISRIIGPTVNLCYPAIIMLTVGNILYKKTKINITKYATFGVLGLTLLLKLI